MAVFYLPWRRHRDVYINTSLCPQWPVLAHIQDIPGPYSPFEVRSSLLGILTLTQKMLITNTISLQAIAFASILQYAGAAPSFSSRPVTSLSKRANTFAGCGGPQGANNLAVWAFDGASTDSYG